MTVEAGPAFLPGSELQALVDVLERSGRRVIGPTVSDGAVVYEEIHAVEELPAGWGAAQEPGSYRLEKRPDGRRFDYGSAMTAWKRFTFPPHVPLTVGRRGDNGTVSFEAATPDPPPLAFLGVRACELAALAVQDRVLLDGPAVDEDYRARRAAGFVVAVECTSAASTCFCTSMNTGPEVSGGFDLALTELDDGYVVRVGSEAGRAIADELPLVLATGEQVSAAAESVAAVRAAMPQQVVADGLPGRLLANLDSPRWAEVAERCLSCANCTLVCPTCFCTSVVQRSDLDGEESVADRSWDSCFTAGFARVAGGNFRPRVQDRYRQWLTHKFATWWDQFGSSGCVGCGRCVTWCPVGIDVREELLAIAGPAVPREVSAIPTALPLNGLVRPAVPLDVRPNPVPAKPPGVLATPTMPLKALATPAPSRLAPPRPIDQSFVTARVIASHAETADTATTRLVTTDPALLDARPGQFVMATLPAFAIPPISISRVHPDGLDLTIRAAGPASTALAALPPGHELAVRGPLGRGWPIEAAYGRDVVIVTGGIGLAPLRPLIDEILAHRDRFGAVRLYYGARTPIDQLFSAELEAWAWGAKMEVATTVDRAGPEWLGPVGVVTHLFDRARWDGTEAVAFVCGPERMMQATAETLAARGLRPERVFVTLERHMECGVGLCGHCQLGRFFVCRDGPVFSLAELGDLFGREGI